MDQLIFGTTKKGKAVHIVTETDSGEIVAKCDKRLTIETFIEDSNAESVTCSKCKETSLCKNALAEPPTKKPAAKKPAAKKPAAKKEAEQKTNEEIKQKETEQETIEETDPVQVILDRFDELSGKIDSLNNRIDKIESTKTESEKKQSEKNYKDILKEGQKNDSATVDGKQFEATKTNDNKYSIIHIATRNVMFTNVEEKVVSTAVKYLNNMRIRWENKHDKIPKDFVSACAVAFKAACKSHGIEINIKTDPNQEEPRIIKRREKQTTRKIKRRTSDNTEEKKQIFDNFGFRLDTPRSDIALLIHQGMRFGEICKMIKNHELSDTETKAKIQSVIRKLTKKGWAIMVIYQEDKNLNYYQILDNDVNQ